ncbi:MAG: acyl-CoA dehydrogenase family protein [Ilumatobacteraceae bacterium]
MSINAHEHGSSGSLESFRTELREFLATNAPAVTFRVGVRSPEDEKEFEELRRWSAALYEAGYYGADWPAEWGGKGGPGADPAEDFVLSEEMARANIPGPIGAGGLAGHAIIAFGTEEQKRRFLPRIRTYEDVWAQLFSEPDAGSDLAGMKTRAVRDGAEFVVTGQKVWSTNAQFADWGYLLARTNPDVAKQAGITAFALDLSLPGIDIRPLREMTGTSDFNEVFLADVRVPADSVIGTVDDGWRVATTSLAEERAGVGAGVARLTQSLESLIDLARRMQVDGRPASQDPRVRQTLARFASRLRPISLMAQATVERRRRGEMRPLDAPIGKLSFSELNYDMANFGVQLAGAAGTLANDDPDAPDAGRWQEELLYARAYTIAGGANEIMRNMLGERALGLPREPK